MLDTHDGCIIVHYEHRYKHSPRKKPKAAAIEEPAVVRAQPTRGPGSSHKPACEKAEDSAKSAIVTTRKRGSEVPDMTPEERRRRGDAAEATFRKIAAKVQRGR